MTSLSSKFDSVGKDKPETAVQKPIQGPLAYELKSPRPTLLKDNLFIWDLHHEPGPKHAPTQKLKLLWEPALQMPLCNSSNPCSNRAKFHSSQ
eukprot:scaffold30660_cov18-Tisochrysis_lutea.AAC.2